MDHGNIFSGGAFKATLYLTLISLTLMTLIGVIGVRYLKEDALTELRELVATEFTRLEEYYDEQGVDTMVARVKSISGLTENQGRVLTLLGGNKTQLFGRYIVPTDLTGWSERTITLVGPPEEQRSVYITAMPIDDFTLVTGGELRSLASKEALFLKTLIGTAALLSFVFIAFGYNMSRLIQIKLEHIDQALAKVADGDIDVRLQVSPANDQIDRVSRTMNAHLDHMAMLTSATKSNAAAIAHDLKRPLSRAFLSLEKAIGEIGSDHDSRETLEETHEELFNLKSIFETVLRISRIDSGQITVKFANIDLAAIVTDLAETYKSVAEESGLSLSVDIAPNKTFIANADEGMLTQLIINLLQNAVTHCPEGTQIKMDLDRADSSIRLTVADNGPGISEQDRAKVFDAFFRTDNSRSEPGTGLGMAMVKSIVEVHRAIITLEDNDPGLRVVFTLH